MKAVFMPSTTRRDMLKQSGVAVGAVALAGSLTSSLRAESVGLPSNWRKIRKIDVHNHVLDPLDQPDASWARVESMLETAERLGIGQLCCSRPITGGAMAEIDEVRKANNSVLAAMKRYPDKISGFGFIQPGNGQAAVDEIQRCFDAGMIGVKLYNQYKYSFGSHMPFDYTAPSLVKLANLESMSAEEYEMISWRNAASFFKIA